MIYADRILLSSVMRVCTLMDIESIKYIKYISSDVQCGTYHALRPCIAQEEWK